MKTVIMVAHDFPPEGSAGVYRPLRFVRYLPQLGWRPAVLSCEKPAYERYDPGLLALIPPGTDVLRVRGRDIWQSIQAKRERRIQEKSARPDAGIGERFGTAFESPTRVFLRDVVRNLEAGCYHPDMAMRWIRPAVQETVRLCTAKPVNVIYATAGPVSAFVVAHRAFRRTGIPYVLDFRDAWTITYNDFEARRPRWAIRRDRRVMRQMLQDAHAVVFRYHAEAECYWRAYRGALRASRIHIIPNGYDGVIETSPVPEGSKCTILYAGTLSSYRYDTLLEALRRLKQADPDRAGRLSVLFVGEGAEALGREAASLDLSDIVVASGPVSHAEVTKLHHDAHALLALGRPSTMKGHELFAGAKIFEYLKAGRPIVGLLPRDETRTILHRVSVSTVADIESTSEIMTVLQRVVDAWSSGRMSSLLPNRDACQEYSAERQTASLARALEGAPAADPFIPGVVQIPESLRAEIETGDWVREQNPTDAEPEPVAAAHREA